MSPFKVYYSLYNIKRMKDKILIDLLKEGDMSAMEAIYHKKYKNIFRIAFRYTGIKEEAEDIMQETFIKIYKKIDKFKYEDENSFDRWITRICINLSLDWLRKKRRERLFLLNVFSNHDREKFSANNDEKNNITRQNFEQAISKLSPKQKTAFILRYFEEYSIGDIAEIMKCSANTVKKHLQRGMRKLKKTLKKEK